MLNEQRLIDDLKASMLARDELKTSTLRMLKAEIMKIKTDGTGREITEEIVIDAVKKLIKQRKDSSEQFKAGNRPELAAKEDAEIKILKVYLPEQLSEDEIIGIVKSAMLKMGVTDKGGMGKLMGSLMNELKGKADGGLVKKIVEAQLLQRT